MLRIYRAPDGKTWQYEEGEQPEGYQPVDEPKAQQKRRAAANKRRDAANKSKGAQDAT